MPKHDVKDDLAGLFKAAFATCHAEMSPRGTPPESAFGTRGQNGQEEDYSLYEDADQAMEAGEPRQVALDASDEEQEDGRREMAAPLLEGFIGDAVTNTLHTGTSQVSHIYTSVLHCYSLHCHTYLSCQFNMVSIHNVMLPSGLFCACDIYCLQQQQWLLHTDSLERCATSATGGSLCCRKWRTMTHAPTLAACLMSLQLRALLHRQLTLEQQRRLTPQVLLSHVLN